MRTRPSIHTITLATALVAVLLVGTLIAHAAPAGMKKIVFSATMEEGDAHDVYMMNPDGSDLVNLTEDLGGSCANPQISPNGLYIAFQSTATGSQEVWVMNVDGSNKRQLTDLDHPYGPSLNDWLDGHTILYAEGPRAGVAQVRAVTVDGSGDFVLIPQPLDGQPTVAQAKLHPDGHTIMVTVQRGSWSPSQDLYLVDYDPKTRSTSNARLFFEDPGENRIDTIGHWSRDGKSYCWNRAHTPGVHHNWDFVCKDFPSDDPHGGLRVIREWDGQAVENNSDLLDTFSLPAFGPEPNEMLAYEMLFHDYREGTMTRRNLDTGQEERLLEAENVGGVDYGQVKYSPTQPRREQIVVTAGASGSDFNIYAMNPDGSNVRNLTENVSGQASGGFISPDGLRMAFRINERSIHVIDTDGTGLRHIVTIDDDQFPPILGNWLDESWILLGRGPSPGIGELWRLNVDTGELIKHTAQPFQGSTGIGTWPRVSPDRQWIVHHGLDGRTLIREAFASRSDGVTDPIDIIDDPGQKYYDEKGAFTGDGFDYCWGRGAVNTRFDVVCKRRTHFSPEFESEFDYTLVDSGGQNLHVGSFSADDSLLAMRVAGAEQVVVRNLHTGEQNVIFEDVNIGSPEFAFLPPAACDDPPIADAGEDATLECQGELTEAALDGSGSEGVCAEIIDWSWFEDEELIASGEVTSAEFSVGDHDVVLTVEDADERTGDDELVVSIVDTTAPEGAITTPRADACFGPADLPVTVEDDFADLCEPSISRTYTPYGPTVDQHGDHDITLTVEDGSGNSASDNVPFTIDLEAPSVTLHPSGPFVLPSTVPFADLFTATDEDGALGGVVHERIMIDGCVLYDGDTHGNEDGLLSDEMLEISEPVLCDAMLRCGLDEMSRPQISVEASDCGGNVGTASLTVPLSSKVVAGKCGGSQ